MTDGPEKALTDRFSEALKSAAVPKIYVNGFAAGTGVGDVSIVLEVHGQPVAFLSMSYTVAKTLAIKLGLTMAEFEAKTGQQMLTTDEVEKLLVQKTLDEPAPVAAQKV